MHREVTSNVSFCLGWHDGVRRHVPVCKGVVVFPRVSIFLLVKLADLFIFRGFEVAFFTNKTNAG